MTQTRRSPGVASRASANELIDKIEPILADHADKWTIAGGLRARRLAALRLPQLRCGCRDPLSLAHLTDECRWGGGHHG